MSLNVGLGEISLNTKWSSIDDIFDTEIIYNISKESFNSLLNYYDKLELLLDNIESIRKTYSKYSTEYAHSVIKYALGDSYYISTEDIGETIGNAFRGLWDLIKKFFQWIWNGIKRLFGIRTKVKCTASSGLAKAAKSNPKLKDVIVVVDDAKKDEVKKQKISPETAKIIATAAPNIPIERKATLVNLDVINKYLSDISRYQISIESLKTRKGFPAVERDKLYSEQTIGNAGDVKKKEEEYKKVLTAIANTKSKVENMLKKASDLLAADKEINGNTRHPAYRNSMATLRGSISYLSEVANAVTRSSQTIAGKLLSALPVEEYNGYHTPMLNQSISVDKNHTEFEYA